MFHKEKLCLLIWPPILILFLKWECRIPNCWMLSVQFKKGCESSESKQMQLPEHIESPGSLNWCHDQNRTMGYPTMGFWINRYRLCKILRCVTFKYRPSISFSSHLSEVVKKVDITATEVSKLSSRKSFSNFTTSSYYISNRWTSGLRPGDINSNSQRTIHTE